MSLDDVIRNSVCPVCKHIHILPYICATNLGNGLRCDCIENQPKDTNK